MDERQDRPASRPVESDAPPRPVGHVVQFYEQDAFLVSEVSRFVGSALVAGEAALVIATERHRRAFETLLSAHGLNVATAGQQGRYVALDAAATLEELMAGGEPDRTRFQATVGGRVQQALRTHRRVSAFGEMVALLWERGRCDAALKLERMWNDFVRGAPVSLLCAYPMSGFRNVADGAALRLVCGEHGTVVPAESYTALPGADSRVRTVVELQQKAAVLEAEIAERERLEQELRAEIARRERLEEELRATIAKLGEAGSRKDEFLAMLGHELRNPLGAVQNALFTATLDAGRRDRALRLARRQADQLARLVDDLLEVARFTEGKIRLNREPVNLDTIVHRAVEATRRTVDARSHRLTVSPLLRHAALEADAARLEQVLVNLISNASKYTPPGGHIVVSAEAEEAEVVLRVRDNGIGLSPEQLPTVFDLFSQGDRSLNRAEGGLGIGLSVVRRIVELHGGRVEARSAGVGQGSEFIVRLPGAASGPARKHTGAVVAVHAAPGAKVLVVEDDEDSAETLMMLLELFGHSVRTVTDGLAAVSLAEELRPDVMLVDIGLPGIDGYEVARRVRGLPHLAGVTLVALTGYADEEHRAGTTAAGFHHHVVKPVDVNALQALLAHLAVTRGAAAQDAPARTPLPPSS